MRVFLVSVTTHDRGHRTAQHASRCFHMGTRWGATSAWLGPFSGERRRTSPVSTRCSRLSHRASANTQKHARRAWRDWGQPAEGQSLRAARAHSARLPLRGKHCRVCAAPLTRASVHGPAGAVGGGSAASFTSTTYRSRARPLEARLAAWMAPIQPAPNCTKPSMAFPCWAAFPQRALAGAVIKP
jgi:hypothetical protein